MQSMTKAALALGLSLTLASCNLLGVPRGDVTGEIRGTQPQSGNVRIALIGLTGTGFENNAVDQLDIGTFNPQKRVYSISLPDTAKAGVYEVLAYVDLNNNKKFDANEPRTQRSTRGLIYATSDASLFGFTVKKGWNRFDGTTVSQTRPFGNYDLNW
ncbi:DUF2141 domain-containing protein [Deinococcus sp. SDU3-2]|uniref:DUF2141 domain-containing protein n=1 Tax=Deinococcus terrestris TaxID=2651870 RepID=A0A7X1NXB8_9DEIO|nr:DUF2141 domain-containing protein [Deinococcus terrestris]MPY67204.1 DUF2141 domain-containing protein [Deinococcus terrestris]